MLRVLAPLLILLSLALPAAAQDRRPSHCIAIADAAPGIEYLHKASYRAPLPDDYTVRIHYVSHASFLIETPGGLTIVTDYTGFVGATKVIPDVVTMNHAHSTHWTAAPDPAIPHVLPGWGEAYGTGIDHHLDLGEVLIRNVSTDIRSGGGREDQGNSIFIFEVGGLCIGHLGHLHHEPNAEQYAAIGRLDVVMAPVDGGMTLPLPVMIDTLKRMKARIVLPMHWFSGYALDAFAQGMQDEFAIERGAQSFIEVSLRSLPDRPTVVMMQPRLLRDPE
ncbi:MBL fold metallo-hydrolase [Mesobacterium pallidum]|uniref:MBL fold metallo-hydrolase n=1 Tax=Mesobacterium pallidum TaxID=2872037 RepID=UPI001EE2D923|nr:MBL fold metallo-hydrolase [Mesobacterium pallidum]